MKRKELWVWKSIAGILVIWLLVLSIGVFSRSNDDIVSEVDHLSNVIDRDFDKLWDEFSGLSVSIRNLRVAMLGIEVSSDDPVVIRELVECDDYIEFFKDTETEVVNNSDGSKQRRTIIK